MRGGRVVVVVNDECIVRSTCSLWSTAKHRVELTVSILYIFVEYKCLRVILEIC